MTTDSETREVSNAQWVAYLTQLKMDSSTGRTADGQLQSSFTVATDPGFKDQVTYRKHGAELYFHEQGQSRRTGSLKPFEIYGYCYGI